MSAAADNAVQELRELGVSDQNIKVVIMLALFDERFRLLRNY